MKSSASFLRRIVTVAAVAGLASLAVNGFAQKKDPVSPNEPKVTICHHPDLGNGLSFSITVAQSAVAAHLAHGDSLGPCASEANVTICHNGNTIAVAQSSVQSHLDHGDTIGPCSALTSSPIRSVAPTVSVVTPQVVAPKVTVAPFSVTPVSSATTPTAPAPATATTPVKAVPSYTAPAQPATPAPAEELPICYKGQTVMVPAAAVQTYLSIGAKLGRCGEIKVQPVKEEVSVTVTTSEK